MIFRSRLLSSCPDALSLVNVAANRERERAATYYAAVPSPTKAMPFKAYKHDAVRKALAHLFGPKCAYCESVYEDSSPMEVEHFRPKGEIVTSSGATLFPGYWWRASAWENLLPSCIDCNRARWHDTGFGRYKYGKQNQFPLAAGSVHAIDEAGIAGETPLLLDPTTDNPENHILFVMREGLGGKKDSVVAPVTDIQNNEDSRGRKSIEIFGLNRGGLVRSRNRQITHLRLALDMIGKDWLTAQQETDPQKREASKVELRRRIRRVASVYLDANEPYASASRAYFKEWRADLQAKQTEAQEEALA
jgi:uncharacterized protein (TIGR02646 family)